MGCLHTDGRLWRQELDVYVVGAAAACFDGLRAVLREVAGLRSVSLIDLAGGGVPARSEPSTARALLLVCSCRLGWDTLEVLSRLHARDPSLPVLVWAADGSPAVAKALAAKAGGFVRACPALELVRAITGMAEPAECATVDRGRGSAPGPVSREFKHLSWLANPTRGRPALSARQEQIGELIAMGLTDKEIARHVGLSYYTVRTHISALLRKCGVSRRAELIALQRVTGSLHTSPIC